MNILKPITLAWWQVGIIKTATLAFALIIAHYWPAITKPVGVWAVVFIVCAIYAAKLRLKDR